MGGLIPSLILVPQMEPALGLANDRGQMTAHPTAINPSKLLLAEVPSFEPLWL